jgi:phospholipase C
VDSALAEAQTPSSLSRINHIIVVYQENRGFDSLYGMFPGANGLANATDTAIQQVGKDGRPYSVLPQPMDTTARPVAADPRFPAGMPVRPFDISRYVPADEKTGDMVHRFYQEQLQIDGGKMDRFVAWSDAAGLVMGHYDGTQMPGGQLARDYTLADNFFHGAFGGSFLNHFWLVCACSPTWPEAPADLIAELGADGSLMKDGAVTPDGFAVNTSYTINSPHPSTVADAEHLAPNQTMPTIGDRLSEKSISWSWFSGGWNDALAGDADPLFQFHHQPFAFFANYADGTAAKAAHLKDERDFFTALDTGMLPAVSFVKPLGPDNEHPGYADLARGQQHVADLVQAVQSSPYWDDTLVVITYDENGGSWDHVAPPVVDRWGPGSRVPTILVSPLAKRGFVDHTQYDTTSILRTIETRWGLQPLGARDAAANDFSNALASVGPGGLTTSSTSAQPSAAWDFALTGDQLYGREGESKYPALAADMEAAAPAFIVFGGDFKNGSTVCDDATFTDRLQRFQASQRPFVFLPGDNEWTDCHRENNGSYDPIERLNKIRNLFYPPAQSLGRTTMPLTNQSSVPVYEKFVENVRWTYGDVMFVGLDIQGSNNNLGRTPEMDAEYAERNTANLIWQRDAFALARQNGNKAIMVIIQADPQFPLIADDVARTNGLKDEGPSGFTDFLKVLEAETLKFGGKPVVLAHGDSHYFRLDKPMVASTSKRRVENFTRLEWFGSEDAHWVKIHVDPSSRNVFTFEPMIVQANLVDHN